MALDEVLAESVRAGGPPFLRFYTWSPATLSLGRFQNLDDGLTDLARRGPLVRRQTGGGGIWHSQELTYSLGCTQEDLGVTGVKASFERLVGFLLDAWVHLGWDARFAKDGPTTGKTLGSYTPACFAGTEEYDILVGGRKLGGNAQKRDRSTIFQHGSIPLKLDHPTLSRLFQPGYEPDPQRTTDLGACGWSGTTEDLTNLLVRKFQERLGVEWEESRPSASELDQVKVLVDTKYGNLAWTASGGGSLRPGPA